MAFDVVAPRALLIATQLPDGCGFELAKVLRVRFPSASMALSGSEPGSARAVLLDASYIAKPASIASLDDFLNQSVCRGLRAVPALQEALYLASRLWQLRPHETLVLGSSIIEGSHDNTARALRLNVNTLKSRIKKILVKSRLDSMRAVSTSILSLANDGSSPVSSPSPR